MPTKIITTILYAVAIVIIAACFARWLAGCTPQQLKHAQARYPHCEVREIEISDIGVEVEVSCPFQKPFTITFKKR